MNAAEKCQRKYSTVIEPILLKGCVITKPIVPESSNNASLSPRKSILQFNGKWHFLSKADKPMDFRYMTSSMFELHDDNRLMENLPKILQWKGNFENFANNVLNHIPENFSFECKKTHAEGVLSVHGEGKNKFGEFDLSGEWNIMSGVIEAKKRYYEKKGRGRGAISPTRCVRKIFHDSPISERVRVRRRNQQQVNKKSAKQTFQSSAKKKRKRGRPRKKTVSIEPEPVEGEAQNSADEEDVEVSSSSEEESSASEDILEDVFLSLADNGKKSVVSRKRRTGFGICVYESGYMYEGQWYKGKKHGKGVVYKIHRKNKTADLQKIFQGEFVDDSVTGIGTFFSIHGDRYDGEWTDGKFNGFGEYFQVNENSKKEKQTYTGEWVSNIRHGLGKLLLHESGAFYDGSWDNNQFHGVGILNVPNKVYFNGDFDSGVMSGRGVCLYYSDKGNITGRYEGGFKEGLRHGRGWYKFYSNKGEVIGEFEGRFKRDEMEGNNPIEVTENVPIRLSKDDWVLPLKRQTEIKYIHQAAGFDEFGN